MQKGPVLYYNTVSLRTSNKVIVQSIDDMVLNIIHYVTVRNTINRRESFERNNVECCVVEATTGMITLPCRPFFIPYILKL